MFRLMNHSQHQSLWEFFVIVTLVLLILTSYAAWSELMKNWPSLKDALTRIDPHLIAGFLTAFAVFIIADRIVEYQLRCMLRKRFGLIWKRTTGDCLSKGDITQSNVDMVLEAMAIQVKSNTDEQRRISTEAKAEPHVSFHQADLSVINEWVAGALKNFWHAHWLARIFGFKVKSSWKQYLPIQTV